MIKFNFTLQNTRLKRDLMESHDKVVEEVQLRNKFLQERLDTLEQQVAQRQQGAQVRDRGRQHDDISGPFY